MFALHGSISRFEADDDTKKKSRPFLSQIFSRLFLKAFSITDAKPFRHFLLLQSTHELSNVMPFTSLTECLKVSDLNTWISCDYIAGEKKCLKFGSWSERGDDCCSGMVLRAKDNSYSGYDYHNTHIVQGEGRVWDFYQNYRDFCTSILERSCELIATATIRRQGMCRRLLDAIEDGDPVWAVSSERVDSLIGYSLNFFFVYTPFDSAIFFTSCLHTLPHSFKLQQISRLATLLQKARIKTSTMTHCRCSVIASMIRLLAGIRVDPLVPYLVLSGIRVDHYETILAVEKRVLIVPPELAYGSKGMQEIPPHSTIQALGYVDGVEVVNACEPDNGHLSLMYRSLLARRALKKLEMDEEYQGSVMASGEDFSVEPIESRRPFRALLDVEHTILCL
ncbi:60S ribosomal protein L5-like protein [Tanacetum coccineum]